MASLSDIDNNLIWSVVGYDQFGNAGIQNLDLIIYKNVIKDLYYDSMYDEVDSEYSQDLMFVIHNAQESNFDGDDLILHINHYKLK